MIKSLLGRTALVTGAGRGIARGIAILMAQQGAKVVVNDLGGSVDGVGRDASPAQQVVNEINANGGEAIPDTGDVSNWQDAENMVQTAIDRWGKLDILVNVAGILREKMIFNMSEDEWDDVIRVHLKGTFCTSHFASIHWRERREYGRLINFTSGNGIHGVPGQANYAAAKAGIIGLTKACANELVRYNVTANCIAPNAATRMADRGLVFRDDNDAIKPSEDSTGTEYDPSNVAPAIIYLASESGKNISGEVIVAEGFHIGLYSKSEQVRHIYNDGPWDLDQVFKIFPETIGKDLQLPKATKRP